MIPGPRIVLIPGDNLEMLITPGGDGTYRYMDRYGWHEIQLVGMKSLKLSSELCERRSDHYPRPRRRQSLKERLTRWLLGWGPDTLA